MCIRRYSDEAPAAHWDALLDRIGVRDVGFTGSSLPRRNQKRKPPRERVGRDASPRDVMRAANIYNRKDFDRLMSSLSFD
jgi:hypothetical protein